MASSLALKRATSTLFNKLVNPIRSSSLLPCVSRSYNTNAQLTRQDDDEQSIDVDRRRDRYVSRRGESVPSFFSDVFDPFSPTRSLSQLMNMMDQLVDNPLLSAASRGMGGGTRRGWDVREDPNALYLRMDMPGLSKDDVKISVEQNTLIIKGEGEKESEDDEYGPRYTSRVDIPPEQYKIEEIKAEMKNGVLKVVVPKVTEEEKKDVIQVNVE